MLSLCMIIKNEESCLDNCLKNIHSYVDEIIIVDTGSVDNSKEIASKYKDKIYDFKWCNDFSDARNFSISKASNDWILVLDADEFLINFSPDILNSLSDKVIGRIRRINIYEDNFGTKKYIEKVNRIFNKNYFKYDGIIHEQLVPISDTKYDTITLDINIEHIGYSKEIVDKTNKIERNIKLLNISQKKNSTDPYIYYQLGKSYFVKKDFRKALNSFEYSIKLLNNFYYEYAEDLIETYGYTLINLQLFSSALDLYKYEKYYNNSPDFLFLMGLVEMNNSNFTKAVNNFLKCTTYHSGKFEGITTFLPFYNIGVIYECLNFKTEALRYYSLCSNYAPALKRVSLLS